MRSENTSAPLRTIVVDDDPLARRVVRDALQAAGIVVIAEASGGREAVELAAHYRPDVVLMDVAMPGMDGIEAVRRLADAAPDVRVVMLTASDDDEVGLLSLRVGAAGFLSKELDVAELPRALHAARSGEAAVSPQLTMRLIEKLRATREDGLGMRPVRSVLTSREWEVLDLLCQGASTEGIAEALVLSTETVRSHVKNLLRKLGVSSRGEAVALARRLRDGGGAVGTAA
jgi:DNA-binding NarL/FixJ family response regulator